MHSSVVIRTMLLRYAYAHAEIHTEMQRGLGHFDINIEYSYVFSISESQMKSNILYRAAREVFINFLIFTNRPI